METKKIREEFLNFFKKNNHEILNGSALTIENDDSLLFTNSGMVQFKNCFLGKEYIKHKNIATSQLCLRVGGKHNDLNNIGISPHHNTLFEMLGNFSFSGYFKREAINLSWDFLIKILNIDKNRLYISVNKDDEETINIWKNDIKISKEKFIMGDKKSNFWIMGKSGPCGYCSEIFYNKDPNKSDQKYFLEIWNLVFMQFNKEQNKIKKLENYSIDTGMGLERIASVMQNTLDNYKIDIFSNLVKYTSEYLKTKNNEISIKIIVDHIKAYIFLANEGIFPSNNKRGYIVKKLIRKAIIQKEKINNYAKLYELIPNFITEINKNYNEIIKYNKNIINIFEQEEKKFEETLKDSFKCLNKIIKQKKSKKISGEDLFLLHDTHGLPIDLIKEITNKQRIKLDIKNFKKEMEKQKNKNIKEKTKNINYKLDINKTLFKGYDNLKTDAKIIKIIKSNKEVEYIKENEEGIIILDKTSFYAEKGGQVGDKGIIEKKNSIFEVNDTKEVNNVFFHIGKAKEGSDLIKLNDNVTIHVDKKTRENTAKNHTATHILHAILKKKLGNHVKQAGSLIKENFLRFDYTHFEVLNEKKIEEIENSVNEIIDLNIKVDISINSLEDIKLCFHDIKLNERYKESIRIVNISDISQEPCAGTHVNSTGEIKLFKILNEYGIGSSVRRIEAITGEYAINNIKENEKIINEISALMKVPKNKLIDSIKKTIEQNKIIKKEYEYINIKNIKNIIKQTIPIKTKENISIFEIKTDEINIKNYNNIINEINDSIIIFYKIEVNLINFAICISYNIENKVNSLKMIENIKKQFDCKGGGKKNLLSGVIENCTKIEELSNNIFNYIQNIKNNNLYLNN